MKVKWRSHKFKLIVILIIACIIILGLKIIKFTNEYTSFGKSYQEIVKINWDIELPKNYKEIYNFKSERSLLGDGVRYHVFEYDSINNLSAILEWELGGNSRLEEEINNILKKESILEKYFPNFLNEYKTFIKFAEDSSKIYIILEENRIYILENIY